MNTIFRKLKSGESFLLLSLMGTNILNFIFNAYLGNVLSFAAFADITLLNTFLYIATVIFTALYNTITHKTALLFGKNSKKVPVDFLAETKKKIIKITIIFSILWIIFIPFTNTFFKLDNYLLSLSFSPIVLIGIFTAMNKGLLQGLFQFHFVPMIIFLEAISKLFLAWMFISLQLDAIVYLAIPFSLILSFLLSIILVKKYPLSSKQNISYVFPKKFFSAALITGFSSIAFLTIDVLLAKHFLPPTEAGQYALLSLIGKMIYFLGMLPNIFMISFISNDEGTNKDPKKSFYKLLIPTTLLSFIAFISLGIFGTSFVPLLFGEKAKVILNYLPLYTGAITLFVIVSSIVNYHLARRQYLFPLLSLALALLMGLGIALFHETILQITTIIFASSIISLVTIGSLHILASQKIFVIRKGWSYE